MDKNKKNKKEKPNKYVDKEKSPSFIADVKTLKENLKIREILRTVKMNSSMRIKAPKGSKVMQNKDFHDDEEFEDSSSTEGQDSTEPPSATNLLVNNASSIEAGENQNAPNEEIQSDLKKPEPSQNVEKVENVIHKSKSLSEGLEDSGRGKSRSPIGTDIPIILTPLESPVLRPRDRKLSLDHTMLSKREGLSQSEIDLNSIGKSPLERKSSFFRKKMDSFLKNTTEIFKRQTSRSVQRKGSTCSRISVSMQSLNEDEAYDSEALDLYQAELLGSVSSVSGTTLARSSSGLCVTQGDQLVPDSLVSNGPTLDGSQQLSDVASSVQSLSEPGYSQESFLHSRAISMSSGLDTAHRPRRRKTSRSNRVTWLASESLTDYFRRLIQDEKTNEMQGCNSFQDISTIPENTQYGSKTDSKGRRLSYQRAVSGEDPVLPTKHQESSFRRRKITETAEGSVELSVLLEEFARFDAGVPPLAGFTQRRIPDEAFGYLLWAENQNEIQAHIEQKHVQKEEALKQAVIAELIHTEARHILYLKKIVEVCIATLHGLQERQCLLYVDAKQLFLNIPDILNSNLQFWETTLYPMIADSFKNNTCFNSDLMAPGFAKFAQIFHPMERYVCSRCDAGDYLRTLGLYADFNTYLEWCHERLTDRLHLSDIMVKPFQRLIQYSLLIDRINDYTTSGESKMILKKMENTVVNFLKNMNRAKLRKEEISKLEEIIRSIAPYYVDMKDEELQKYFNLRNENNLDAPMVDCAPDNSRAVIFSGNLRFTDNKMKDAEVFVILMSDMCLICKRFAKGMTYSFKMIRAKYMLKRLMPCGPTILMGAKDLVFLVADEHGSAYTAFRLSPSARYPSADVTMRTWELMFLQARMVLKLSVWIFRYPVRDLSEIEQDYLTEEFKKNNPGVWAAERRARTLVAAMIYPNAPTKWVYAPSPDDPVEPGRGPPNLQNPYQRVYLGSGSHLPRLTLHSSSSTMSSFRYSESGSSIEKIYREPMVEEVSIVGSSTELLMPAEEMEALTRQVPVAKETECETVVPPLQPAPPTLVVQQPSPNNSPRAWSASNSPVSSQPTLTTSVSLSERNLDQPRVEPATSSMRLSASDLLYLSHQEVLKNKAASQAQLLTTGGPAPTSPNRGSLKRGLAFIYPPLLRTGSSSSQSQLDQPQPSTSTAIPVPAAPPVTQEPIPGCSKDTSGHRPDKKKQQGATRRTSEDRELLMADIAGGTTSTSGEPKTSDNSKNKVSWASMGRGVPAEQNSTSRYFTKVS